MKAVVFDFDGTLLLSNSIKTQGFYHVVQNHRHGPSLIDRILSEKVGDRYAIFCRYSNLIGSPQISSSLSESYSYWCDSKLRTCSKRKGASDLLALLACSNVPCFINSATPSEFLTPIVDVHFPGYFSAIYGGYGNKVENLLKVKLLTGLNSVDILMIGDGIDDSEAASEFGCHFIGVSGGTLSQMGTAPLVDDLNEVAHQLGLS